MKKCAHTWYMREPGIQCTKCLIVWESDEEWHMTMNLN